MCVRNLLRSYLEVDQDPSRVIVLLRVEWSHLAIVFKFTRACTETSLAALHSRYRSKGTFIDTPYTEKPRDPAVSKRQSVR